MARYNSWQNSQLRGIVRSMDQVELTKDRGAFFGSIFATLNHILWGDTLWMSRWCSDVPAPIEGVVHTELTPTIGAWDAERFRMDGRIRIWAETLSNVDLLGTEEWYSKASGQNMHKSKAICIASLFNHQTHHRGQVSQMLSQMGITPPVSDLIFMPEDA
ncbi:DinB family protein [uncultured Sulfitobacter sp.]|uniref:DinB family protein n=1 Tax=uncultured Sulfitobacter sp. TaxID=191468 RepID=UPI00262DCC81|nr:DinB family protein [uncultured Sulfitobacter sp.]